MSAVTAPAKLASASPASSVTVRLARRPAIATSPPIETSAPAMPASGTANEVAPASRRRSRTRRRRRPPAARRTAPARPADCAAGPATRRPTRPSVAPISSASSVRGSRMSRTMMPAGPSPPNRPASAARGDSPAGPTISDSDRRARRSAPQAPALSRRPLGSACVIASSGRLSYRLPACASQRNCGLSVRLERSMPLRIDGRAWSCAGGRSRSRCVRAGARRRSAAPRRVVQPLRRPARGRARRSRRRSPGFRPMRADPALVGRRRQGARLPQARLAGGMPCPARARPRAGRPLGPLADAADAARRSASAWSRSTFVSDLAAARAQIREVAALLGHPERGEALIADIDAARAGSPRRRGRGRRARCWSATAATQSGPRASPPR